MTEPNSKRVRTTPRQSIGSDLGEPSRVSTPYTNLRNLAALIRPPSTPHTASRTPRHNGSGAAGPSVASRRTPRARAGQPTTPHALKALQARRAATLGLKATPGRERRRSQAKAARETPRDLLRNLSKVLARKTLPIHPSPPTEIQRSSQTHRRNPVLDEDFDIGPHPKPPRLSLALGELESGSEDEAPPRLSSVALASSDTDEEVLAGTEQTGSADDADTTLHSVEGGRRARGGRRSLAAERFADLAAELGIGLPPAGDLDAPDDGMGDTTQIILDVDGESFLVENTTDVQSAMDAARRRRSRLSLLPEGEFNSEPDEPTFVFRVPDGMRRSSVRAIGVTQEDIEELIAAGAEDGEVIQEDEDEEEEDVNAQDTEAAVDAEDSEQITEDDEAATDEMPLVIDGGAASIVENEYAAAADEAENTAELLEHDDTHQTTLLSVHSTLNAKSRVRKPKRTLISRHGIPYPSLPTTTVKRLATAFARTSGAGNGKISGETLSELMQATDWFFEQAGDDLASYAAHAGRKTVEESDVVTLMKRQRQITANATPFSLAQKYLPRELVQEIRMPPPSKMKKTRQGKGKRKRMETIQEDEADEGDEASTQML